MNQITEVSMKKHTPVYEVEGLGLKAYDLGYLSVYFNRRMPAVNLAALIALATSLGYHTLDECAPGYLAFA